MGDVSKRRIKTFNLRRRRFRFEARAQKLGIGVVPRKVGELWSYSDVFECRCIREHHSDGDYTVIGGNSMVGITGTISHRGIYELLPKNWLVI